MYDVLNEIEPYKELMLEIRNRLDIHKGDYILDAGAGTGNLAVHLANKGGRVMGLDSSPEGLEIFHKKLPDHKIMVADLTKPLPFGDRTFDKICTNNAVYTLPPDTRPALFREFMRVLKPGGVIVSSNIVSPFKPIRIYIEHIRYEYKKSGALLTMWKVLRFVRPTIMIFYYNRLIKLEHAGGGYRLFESGEQKRMLTEAGFVDVSDDIIVYAGQGLLNYARKPE